MNIKDLDLKKLKAEGDKRREHEDYEFERGNAIYGIITLLLISLCGSVVLFV